MAAGIASSDVRRANIADGITSTTIPMFDSERTGAPRRTHLELMQRIDKSQRIARKAPRLPRQRECHLGEFIALIGLLFGAIGGVGLALAWIHVAISGGLS